LPGAQGGRCDTASAHATFPRNRRLLRPAEFRRVFADPCRCGGPNFLFLARRNELGYPRLGLAIAKRHVRSAVDRNRIKRIVRESFRQHQGEPGPLDIVVLARPGLATVNRAELRAALDRKWRVLAERCDVSSSS